VLSAGNFKAISRHLQEKDNLKLGEQHHTWYIQVYALGAY